LLLNRQSQQQLERALSGVATRLYAAIGSDASGGWPGEGSAFAVGVSRSDAEDLARQFMQNAFVWIERDREAELVLLR
jgi:hypothetical protein